MHIVVDLELDRPATAARQQFSTPPALLENGLLLRWLREQFLALPHSPTSTRVPSPPVSSHEKLAN